MEYEQYEPTYWSDKGRYQRLYVRLMKELVPREGNADTDGGEILRIVSNWYYDIYNNGGCNRGVHSEDLSKFLSLVPRYAKRSAFQFVSAPRKRQLNDEEYMEFLDKFVDWAVLYVNALKLLDRVEKELK